MARDGEAGRAPHSPANCPEGAGGVSPWLRLVSAVFLKAELTDNRVLHTVAPSSRRLHSPSSLCGLLRQEPAPFAGKRRGRGRPQARRIASRATRHSAASRPAVGRLIWITD